MKISIIIACLNSEKTIEKAISSLKNQNYDDLEVVIIDGASTDETISLIKKQNLHDIKIICENDKGIGDAWNKGLEICGGDLIGILNSDDYYHDNILQRISDFFIDVNVATIGYGDVILIDGKNGSSELISGKIKSKLGLLNGFGFMHPSVFFNRQTLEKVGPFSTSIRIAVDTDWLLRAVSMGISFRKIPSLTYMRSGGISDLNRYTAMGEYADALTRNGFSDLHMLIFFMLRFLGAFRRLLLLKCCRLTNK